MEGEEAVDLGHHVEAEWYLREVDGRPNPYGPRDGIVAVLYDGELYDISTEQWRFRQFGIPWKEVQRDTYIVIVPPPIHGHDEQQGVYPLGGRDTLGIYVGKPLPFGDWGMAFAQALPPAIRQRFDAVRPSTEDIDRAWKDRFAERYLNRWRQLRHRLHTRGDVHVDPAYRSPVVNLDATGTSASGPKRPKRPRNVQRTLTDEATTSDRTARGQHARKVEMAAAIPDWVPARADDMDEPYLVAAYDPTRENSDGSRGAVLLNIEHDAVVQFVEEFQAAYPPQADRPGRGAVLERARAVARREGRARPVAVGTRAPRGDRA